MKAVGARLLGFVLDDQLDLGQVLGALDGALDDAVPGGQIVGLERIVVAILAEPQVHDLAVHLLGPLHRLFDLVDGVAADLGVVGRERAPAPLARGPDVGRDAGHLQAGVLDLAVDLVDVVVVDVPEADHLDAREPLDLRGGLDQLLAGQPLAIARKDVAVGAGVEGIDVRRKA